ESISAYRETTGERLRRWTRRHRTLVQTAAVALITIAAIAVAATILVNGARQREATAKQQAHQMYVTAQTYLDRWLPGVSDVLRYVPGGSAMRERMLAAAANDYQRLAEYPTKEPRLELERGRSLLRLGEVRRELGRPTESADAFVQAEQLFVGLGTKYPQLA